jgi:hypothetical protein
MRFLLEKLGHLIARGLSEHFVCSSHNELRNFRAGRKISNGSWLEFGFLERTSTMMMSLTWVISSVGFQMKEQLGHFICELLLIDYNFECALDSEL